MLQIWRHVTVQLLKEFMAIIDGICCPQDCKEFLVWEVVVRWAQCASNSSSPSARSLAEVEQALPLIRFPLMSVDELNTVAVHSLARRCSLLTELVAEARAARADAARAEELQVLPSSAACTCNGVTSL